MKHELDGVRVVSSLSVSFCGLHGWCDLPVEFHGGFVVAPDEIRGEDKETVRRVCLERDGRAQDPSLTVRATTIFALCVNGDIVYYKSDLESPTDMVLVLPVVPDLTVHIELKGVFIADPAACTMQWLRNTVDLRCIVRFPPRRRTLQSLQQSWSRSQTRATLRRILNSLTRLRLMLNSCVREVFPRGCLRHDALDRRWQPLRHRVAEAKRQSTQLNKCLKPSVASPFNSTLNPPRPAELSRARSLAPSQWRQVSMSGWTSVRFV